jgi:SAM-dependent methyltransferase
VVSSHKPIDDSSTLIERTGIPRKVLSRLLGSTKIGVGFRVLDVGCGRGDLAAYFASLGILCTGVDESPTNVIEARRAVPTSDFSCGSMTDPIAGPRGGFDLVLVREMSLFQKSLLSTATLAASVKLLARVRPGGCLAVLARIDTATASAVGHQLSCYERHVGALPGAVEMIELQDSVILGRAVRARSAGQTGSGYAIAVLRLPLQPMSQDDWTHAADYAARAAGAPCCQWAARGASSVSYRSKAA